MKQINKGDLLRLNCYGYALEQCFTSGIEISGDGTIEQQCNELLDLFEEWEEMIELDEESQQLVQWYPSSSFRQRVRDLLK